MDYPLVGVRRIEITHAPNGIIDSNIDSVMNVVYSIESFAVMK